MNQDDVRELLFASLKTIAPEVDTAGIDPHADLREEIDLDSMDFARFVRILHEKSGLLIPEADYRKLFTLATGQDYLLARLIGQPG